MDTLGGTYNSNFNLTGIDSPSPERLHINYTNLSSLNCSKFVSKMLSSPGNISAIINGADTLVGAQIADVSTRCSGDENAVTIVLTNNILVAGLTPVTPSASVPPPAPPAPVPVLTGATYALWLWDMAHNPEIDIDIEPLVFNVGNLVPGRTYSVQPTSRIFGPVTTYPYSLPASMGVAGDLVQNLVADGGANIYYYEGAFFDISHYFGAMSGGYSDGDMIAYLISPSGLAATPIYMNVYDTTTGVLVMSVPMYPTLH